MELVPIQVNGLDLTEIPAVLQQFRAGHWCAYSGFCATFEGRDCEIPLYSTRLYML